MTSRPFPGQCAQRFRPERVLGEGSQGVVWLTTQLALDRPAVVKVLQAEQRLAPDAHRRFVQEARITASIRHPGVVLVLDHGVDEGVPWIAYEHLPGRTLRERIDAERRLSVDIAVKLALRVAQALQAAHAAGVLHRDVKPENVLEDGHGEVKVADFGMARWTGASEVRTATGIVVGSPAYLAPELLSGGSAGVASDLYALGVMLYELVAGVTPFTAGTLGELLLAHLNQRAPRLSAAVAQVPPALDRIVETLLEKRPDARFDSAAELASRLEAFLQTEYPGAALGRELPRTTPRPRPGAWLLLTALAVGGAMVAASRSERRPASSPPAATVASPAGDMVLVPAGSFRMGDASTPDNPPRTVTLGAFFIDRHEVTRARFAAFAAATGRRLPRGAADPEKTDHPVAYVTFEDALAFARWNKKRLPTEAEWEKAARGVDGRRYPWGNTLTGIDTLTNVAVGNVREDNFALLGARTDRYLMWSAPVGSFPRDVSPFGALDMGGNVSEICLAAQPGGPPCVVRGADFARKPVEAATFKRWTCDAESPHERTGFRCALDGGPD